MHRACAISLVGPSLGRGHGGRQQQSLHTRHLGVDNSDGAPPATREDTQKSGLPGSCPVEFATRSTWQKKSNDLGVVVTC